jgi:hypothetical protein
MALVFKAPEDIPDELWLSHTTIFLAGTIDMGDSEDWQSKFEKLGDEFLLINPRRTDWDSSWHKDSVEFKRQVNWELDNLERCDIIVMNFEPHSKSPISLLELGLFIGHGKMYVICPDEFYRKGNVEIVCERYECEIWPSIQSVIEELNNSVIP